MGKFFLAETFWRLSLTYLVVAYFCLLVAYRTAAIPTVELLSSGTYMLLSVPWIFVHPLAFYLGPLLNFAVFVLVRYAYRSIRHRAAA